MNPYKARYRQLLANGVSAWAGDGFARAKIQREKTFHWLDAHGYLPTPGAPVLELGCGNGVMTTQYLAKRSYAISGVDVSGTAVHWAEDHFQQTGLDATFFVGNIYHLSQCKDTQFALIIDGGYLRYLLEDKRCCFLAEARRLLKSVGRLVIGSMCRLPRYTEDLATYDPVKHHLLKKGQPWRTLKPLPALLNEIQQTQFSALATDVKHNAQWDRTTVICSVDKPSADPQKN